MFNLTEQSPILNTDTQGVFMVTLVAFVLMIIGAFGAFISAASHTPYAVAGWAVFTFVAAVIYHKAPEA